MGAGLGRKRLNLVEAREGDNCLCFFVFEKTKFSNAKIQIYYYQLARVTFM